MSIRKYIPDFITSLNLLCGALGIVCAMDGRVDLAFCLMLAAAVFDFLDGLAARLLGAYSELGKELDSLSDVVSFGVLPSLMLVQMMRACSFSNSLVCLVPLLLAVFSGLRLAKFNVDERQHESFLGLPTPLCAIMAGSMAYFVAVHPSTFLSTWASGPVFVPVLVLVLCALLVSEIPMFSFKFGGGKASDSKMKTKRIAMLIASALVIATVAVLKLNWSLAVRLICTVYIIKNCIYAVFKV